MKEEKTALITGGAKRLGRAISKDLARSGYNVIIHYNNSEDDAFSLREELLELGNDVHLIQANLLNEGETISLFDKCKNLTDKPVNLLINNASIFEYDNIKTATLESWDRHHKSNLQVPFFLTQKFAQQAPEPEKLESGELESKSCIINIIDQRVQNLTTDFTTYTLAKSALWTLTRISAKALAPQIRVNAIGPGPTLKAEFQSVSNYKKQRLSTPLNRGSSTFEICSTVKYFADNPSVSGQLICVDGGQNLQAIKKTEEIDQ
ncbi:SDR family oxidoreductase [Paracoccaceae bacterium]|nr:SDR family oxidoreductase [Paracoccaceae bacterium]